MHISDGNFWYVNWPLRPLLSLYVDWYQSPGVVLLAIGVAPLWVELSPHSGHAHIGGVEGMAAVEMDGASSDTLAQRSLSLSLPPSSHWPRQTLVTLGYQPGAQLKQEYMYIGEKTLVRKLFNTCTCKNFENIVRICAWAWGYLL
jgi:hypothetical protein